MLSWIAVHTQADRLERDLEQRARSALASAGYEWASVAFSGRDALLVGTPAKTLEVSEAVALVRGVWGVGRVTAQSAIAAPGTSAAPASGPALMRTSALVSADTPASGRNAKKARVEKTAALQPSKDAPADGCDGAARVIAATAPLQFGRGVAALDRRKRVALDRLASLAAGCTSIQMRVSGHADARGDAQRNMRLAQERARVAVAYLISKGVDASRLEAIGYGDTHPAAPNDSTRDRAKNRRIEVEVLGFREGVSARQGAGNGLSDR